MMTLEQLNAIRQRVEKAKAGRWISLRTNTLGSSIYDIVTEAQEKGLHYGVCVTYHRGTADFLAHSISDIPALLDEVEALQRELEDLHSGRTIPRIAQEQVSADAKARRAEYKAKYVKEETK